MDDEGNLTAAELAEDPLINPGEDTELDAEDEEKLEPSSGTLSRELPTSSIDDELDEELETEADESEAQEILEDILK